MKAQQNPCEDFPPLARYDVLGNMIANDGAMHAFDHLETSVALEQKQRHADLLVEGADVVAFCRLLHLIFNMPELNQVKLLTRVNRAMTYRRRSTPSGMPLHVGIL